MKYMGSKSKIAKYILPIILKDRTNQTYVEPFVGGCNMIDKVDGNRIGADSNKYLIAMWQGLQKAYSRPVLISKALYVEARNSYNKYKLLPSNEITLHDFLIGYIGWMGSFNGRFFDGGYSGQTKDRDYVDEQVRNTLKQIDSLKGVQFIYSSYFDLNIPDKSIIYCDPPYENTKQYSTSKDFNHSKFWQWCRDMKNKGHQIFISEYKAPEDFICVWQKEVTNSMNSTKTYKPIERLFTL